MRDLGRERNSWDKWAERVIDVKGKPFTSVVITQARDKRIRFLRDLPSHSSRHSSRFESIRSPIRTNAEEFWIAGTNLLRMQVRDQQYPRILQQLFMLLAPPVFHLPRTIPSHPSRSENTQTSDKKDRWNTIPCGTDLEFGALVKNISDGSASSTRRALHPRCAARSRHQKHPRWRTKY